MRASLPTSIAVARAADSYSVSIATRAELASRSGKVLPERSYAAISQALNLAG